MKPTTPHGGYDTAARPSVPGTRGRVCTVPLDEAHLDAVAGLLAARHHRDRLQAPELPARFADPCEARAAIRLAMDQPHAGGVLAVRDGRPIGYLLGSLRQPPPSSTRALWVRPHSAWVSYAGHAVAPGEGGALYQAMYAALAPQWLAARCTTHYVEVPAACREAQDSLVALGFGQDMVLGVRDTTPSAGSPADPRLAIRRAGPEDVAVVTELAIGLARFHAGPPIYFPYLPETEAEQRAEHVDLLADPVVACWLGDRSGRVAGMQLFAPLPATAAMLVPERCCNLDEAYTTPDLRGGGVGAALLRHSMAWAAGAGYAHCTVAWLTANLVAARFWGRHGFRPLSYRLCRQIDERLIEAPACR